MVSRSLGNQRLLQKSRRHRDPFPKALRNSNAQCQTLNRFLADAASFRGLIPAIALTSLMANSTSRAALKTSSSKADAIFIPTKWKISPPSSKASAKDASSPSASKMTPAAPKK